MKQLTQKQLIKATNITPNNPQYDKEHNLSKGWDADAIKDEKEKTLYSSDEEKSRRIALRLKEIYSGRYGYRTTQSGRKVAIDEPDSDKQLRQSDAIQAKLKAQKTAASRERLKSKGAVPIKSGRRLFEDFCKEAYKNRTQQANINDADLRNIYNAATQLDYQRWLIWIMDEYKGMI